eukprot:5032706-Pyramimonas_sp.AAC.1
MNPTKGGTSTPFRHVPSHFVTFRHARSHFVTFHHVPAQRKVRTWHAARQCDQVEGLALALGDEA